MNTSTTDPTELAETVEAEMMYDYETQAPAAARRALGIATNRIGGGVVLAARHAPYQYWSKALGFGFTEPVSHDLISQVLDFYRGRGAAMAVLQIAPSVLPAGRAGPRGRRRTVGRLCDQPVRHGQRAPDRDAGPDPEQKEYPMPQKAPAAVRGAFSFLGRTAPGPAAALAARAFLRVGRPAPVRVADRPMHEEARRGHLSHESVDVATYTWGDPHAPAALLVHGWQSRASAFGSLVSALTGAGLRVVAYDAPAHGDSGGRTRTALDDVAIVRRLTDVEAEPWAGVVGHSLGSLAAGVAVREGVPTQRLAGIASIASFRFTEDVFVRAIGLPWSLRDRFSRAVAHRLRDNPEVTPDVADRFDLVKHPLPRHVRALWLHDDGDQQIPQAQSDLLLEAHPHSGELVTTTGLGHNRILGDTAAHTHVVDHFT